MTENEQINKLDLQNVQPENFIDLGTDVVDALHEVLGENTLRALYEESKGESKEGFSERFASSLERYIQTRDGFFESTDDTQKEHTFRDDLKEEIKVNLDEMRKHYAEMRETHLSRNIFVSWEKLRIDLAARRNDEIGADGKYKVSGGTIAVDILGIIRGNIFETILETVLRSIFDALFPADRDPVTRDESAETVMETSPVDTTVPVDMVGTMGVHDSGMADKANASIDREMVETVRAANPLYGQHFGFDMTKDGMQNGSMTIWREGYPQRADVVIDGSSRQVWIPDIRMVELHGNYYHVSPFGQVLNSDIHNPRTELAVGSIITQIDVSAGRWANLFEALASNGGLSLEALKEKYTDSAMDRFVAKIEAGLDSHCAYLKDTALPEIREIENSYRRDLFVLNTREIVITRELDTSSEERKEKIEGKLDKLQELKSELEKGIALCEARAERLQDTIERYNECKAELEQKDSDAKSRYMAASNTEKEALGRTDAVEYISKDVDRAIDVFIRDERDVFKSDIERYNEKNPDNPIREKDGEYYNRFGISESGKYDPNMCDAVEKPETDDPIDMEDFVKAHEQDGFEDLKEHLSEREDAKEKAESPGSQEEGTDKLEENKPDGEDKVAMEEKGREDTEKKADAVAEEKKDTDYDSDKVTQTDSKSDAAGIDKNPDVEHGHFDDDKKKEMAIDRGKNVDTANETPWDPDHVDKERNTREVETAGFSADEKDRGQIEKEQRRTDMEGRYDGEPVDLKTDKQSAIDKEPKNLKLDPIEAIHSDPDENMKAQGDSASAEKKEQLDQEDTEEKDDRYDEIVDGFKEYLDDDTYSFGGDFVRNLGDEAIASPETEKMMVDVLCQFYMNEEIAQDERLYSLTMEVACFSDRGIMNVIEDMASGLESGGMSEFDIAQTLRDLEPIICDGIDDLVSISADDVEQRTIRIGDDVWAVSPGSITNIITGASEDPNNLVGLISDSVDRVYGLNIGDTAADQTLARMQDMDMAVTVGHELDFLDMFFGGELERTLHQVFNDLIPESMREMFAEVEQPENLETIKDNSDAIHDNIPELDLMEDPTDPVAYSESDIDFLGDL